MKTLNEQLNRMKSLMGDERLYGNLVDKNPINEWKYVAKLIGVSDDVGEAFLKNSDDAEELLKNTIKYFDESGIAMKYSDDFLPKYYTKTINSIDDLVTHYNRFRPAYKFLTKANPNAFKNYESLMKYLGDGGEPSIIMKNASDGNPIFTHLPKENDMNLIVLRNYLNSLDDVGVKTEIEKIQNLYRNHFTKNVSIFSDDAIESTLHYPTKTIDDLVREIGWDWRYFGKGITPPKMSGWKFHVFGNTLDDSLYLKNELEPLLQKWDAYGKVGGKGQVEGFIHGHNQYGKQGATIYIPQSIIDSGQQKQFYDELVSTLSKYKNKGGTINGDKMLTPQIHYRYELTDVIPPGGLRDYKHYNALYNNASANANSVYKPNNVVDLFSTKPKLSIDNYLSTKFGDTSEIIWDNILNAKNVDDYDKVITKALKTGDYYTISRGGFENYGINDFREYIKNLYGGN